MMTQIDPNDPNCAEAAAEILRRHHQGEPEANITTAVRNFLTVTGLVSDEEIVEENPPAQGSRRAVDLTALDTFIEFKRRIGTAGGFAPDRGNVRQLDDYLAQSQEQGRVRMGILTDGKYWLLRWPGAGAVRAVRPYVFTLEKPDRWITLYEWLRDHALMAEENILPSRPTVEERFGPSSPSYQRDIAVLQALYDRHAASSTIKVKRQLWQNLLTAALGEVASSTSEMDGLFVRHTYLSAVIGMVVQASFGTDIYRLAETDPGDLLHGRDFLSKTGLQGVVESDFFAWPAEVDGLSVLRTLARRVAKFDWSQAPNDIAAILYETVIPPDERRQLGEYYTPDWLARAMVREVVTEPLDQYVLDPTCGSGTFIAEAVTHFIEAAEAKSVAPQETLERLRFSVTGIDVHPVAVHLARAAWVLAAQPAIEGAIQTGFAANITVPVYLGDALQLRSRTGDMFAEHEVTVQVEGDPNTELVFPIGLVDRAETFDALMGDIADAIESGEDPQLALDDHGITAPGERNTLKATIATLQRLHGEGRDHIWAYYTRNLVRPVALSRRKVDVIIGNPPWLNYNKTLSTLRKALEDQSKNIYGIWAGGRYATHQDVAGLFFARCVDLYLKDGGTIGMVMPHSALQTGQYAKWRSGEWTDKRTGRRLSVDFAWKTAWDLERLQPNSFFPIPASVVFAERVGQPSAESALAGEVEQWLGKAGASDVRRERAAITDTSVGGGSPYAGYSTQGAVIVPRCLLFVEETESPAIVRAGQTVTVNPRRGRYDKAPWRDVDLTAITQQTVENSHLFDVHLGETLVPYATLNPLKALMPLRQDDAAIPGDPDGVGGIHLGGLERRMRGRWRTVSGLWEQNKSPNNRLNLLGQLDYYGKLTAQLEWRRKLGDRPVRVVYNQSGAPTAALLHEDDQVVDYTLYWVACKNTKEAHYLLAIINSQVLYEAVASLMPKGQFGARHLQKHLWKLPIPEFDPGDPLHVAVSETGRAAAEGAARELASLRQTRSKVTVTIARRELRKWLRESDEGKAVEAAVTDLLS
ncbi:MAG: N-6 DNA methylase [Chloroflexi bacterium]|nr:N-6 DNA methylase [Chloroflexota bacterium]